MHLILQEWRPSLGNESIPYARLYPDRDTKFSFSTSFLMLNWTAFISEVDVFPADNLADAEEDPEVVYNSLVKRVLIRPTMFEVRDAMP